MTACKKRGEKQTGMIRLIVPSGIRWTVEKTGIILVNESTGKSLFVGYPEAALWDLMQRGYSFSKIVKLLSAVVMKDEAAAETLAAQAFRRWIDQGFLSGADHG